jgi:hypothetical protein
VEVPLLLQFSIALFTGMVAATFVPPVRRSIPKVVEVLLWVALVAVCTLGVLSITDPNARELSSSAAWGVDQVINTTVGLMLGGVAMWMSDHRFAIAFWFIIAAGVDLMALALLRSRRAGMGWQPRVRLREWMELPIPGAMADQPLAVPDPIAELNRKLAGVLAIAGTTLLAGALNLAIWVRDVLVPREAGRAARAAAVGGSHSRASLDSLRDASAHLRYAASAWSKAMGQSAVLGLRPARPRPGQVVDIQALLTAQSIGWFGPLSTGPSTPAHGEEDGNEPERTDRLAS